MDLHPREAGYDSQAAEVDTTRWMSWRAWFFNRARFIYAPGAACAFRLASLAAHSLFGVGFAVKIIISIFRKETYYMKIKLVPWIQQARGKSGDTVFREVRGETIVAATPSKRKTPFGPSELAVQDRFAMASAYAEMVMLNPPLLALYQQASEKKGKSAYILARQDWFDAPKVSFSDASFLMYNGREGDVIKFVIRDEIEVDQVHVTLFDEQTGAVIETGQAVPEVAGTKFWMYTATRPVQTGSTVSFEVVAYDHPGNAGQAAGSKNIA
jgi:hypothetical protein